MADPYNLDTTGPLLRSGLEAVNRAIAEIPEGHTHVVLVHADTEGVDAAVAIKVGDEWRIAADVEKRWKEKGVSGSVSVVWSR